MPWRGCWDECGIPMRIIARRTLREFWQIHPDAEQPPKAWFAEATKAQWQSPNDIKQTY